ncbi:MAG: DUF1844 domain-containing protein [Syntrophales bacterium]|jgi:hypothetical protein|nr:DUF1844 domain-containing protein [Syntrophales bacterium]MCU0555076.1 DUF1844 domain-containing protein [Syntrophales bacterium]MCU0584270.1 DUF1844 domain-containing protein [Syntrophales bacterium]
MDDEKQEKGFVIKDRRRFDDSGEARPEPPKEEASSPQKPNAEAKEAEPRADKPGKPAEEEASFPDLNFSTFVFSLGTSAMYHFGDFPDPVTKKAERNLEAAKQTIDILGILQDKTKGNLSEDEERLLESLLYELRMRYVREKGT